MIRAAFNWIRVRWLEHEIGRLDARINETQGEVDAWPRTRGTWLVERSRLEMLRDRISGRRSPVSYLFGGRARP